MRQCAGNPAPAEQAPLVARSVSPPPRVPESRIEKRREMSSFEVSWHVCLLSAWVSRGCTLSHAGPAWSPGWTSYRGSDMEIAAGRSLQAAENSRRVCTAAMSAGSPAIELRIPPLSRVVEAEPSPSTIQHDYISPDSASLVFLVGRYLRTSVQALSAVTPTQSRLRSSRYHSQFTESHARDARGLFRLRAVTCTRGAALVTLGGKRSQCPHLPRELLGAAADG